MSDTRNGFGTRLKNVERKHAKMARGYDCKVGRDGLIVFKPKRRRARFPWKGLMLLAIGVLSFKGLVIAYTGDDAYDQRVAELRVGTMPEQFGAVVMQTDPVSAMIATQIRPFL